MTTTSVRDIAAGNKPQSPVAAFSRFLDGYKSQIALALPKHLNPDRMARLAVSLFASDAKLQECSPQSIVAGIMTASALGLEIGVNGQAYLIPYKGKATFVPGWKGLVDIVNRSGRASVWTGAVFEGDDFDYALGDAPFVRHRPGDETDPKKLTHVYAIGRVNGNAHAVIEVWTMKKVWKHRDAGNQQGTRHYSFRHPEMYARKVALLQVLKYMPSSIELANAVTVAHAAEEGRPVTIEGNFTVVGEADPSTGEIVTSPGAARTYAQIADAIQNATDADAAALELDAARDEVPADQHAELAEHFKRVWGA